MVGEVIWLCLQLLTGYNLVLPLILFFSWRLFSSKSRDLHLHSSQSRDYAVVVTAYQETQMLSAVVDSILALNYSNYTVYIVADNCDVTNLKFTDDRIKVLSPPGILASNTRSHLYAMNSFVRPHTHITIIDSDNLLDREYLNQLNLYFDAGFSAVQGLRGAKNTDTEISRLDAVRDIYYHFYDGRILFDLGSSATLAGSGMAFTTDLYSEFLNTIDVTGAGFDKVLQNFILRKDNRIAFAEQAIVYDEKTSRSDQLVHQRSRWINTWFKYFKFGFRLIILGLKRMSLNQFLFGLILLRPPLFMFLSASMIFLMANIWINPIVALWWLIALSLFVLSFVAALVSAKPDAKIYRSLLGIPRFIILQLFSLAKSKNANKKSIATRHYYNNTTHDSVDTE
jgi:cellulose synthase/poly-beta-1,6-N-acetylglucosamine synthase-like glycosyltransferase